jgi:peptide/nickel transport system permease protein
MSTPLSASVEVGTVTARPRRATGFWRRALRHRSFVAGGTLSLMVLCAALLSLVWTASSPSGSDLLLACALG